MIASWSELIGHRRIVEWFATAIRRNRMGGSFLLVGSPGVGKSTVAQLLAQTLLCRRSDPKEMRPCGGCESCHQVRADSHPDLITVRKPDDRSFIPLDLLIGPPEARMREGFCRNVRLKPTLGTRKVAILHDADFLNEEGANCLLKTLEEPPADAVILLIGTSEQRQLPTIRSRCQIIRFASPRGEEAVRLLQSVHGVDASPDQIADTVEIAGGDMHAAARMLRGDSEQSRQAIVQRLSDENPDPIGLARAFAAHVEQAGKEASQRRGVLRDLFAIAVQTYRSQMRSDAANDQIRPVTLRRLDRSIRALREVDRSANQSTLIECYAADIAEGTTGDRGEIG